MNLILLSHCIQKSVPNGFQLYNDKTLRLPEENTEDDPHDLEWGKDFLNTTQ